MSPLPTHFRYLVFSLVFKVKADWPSCNITHYEAEFPCGLMSQGWMEVTPGEAQSSCLWFSLPSDQQAFVLARLYCWRKGADLVVIDNEDFNTKLLRVTNNGVFHIGLRDTVKKGEYRWLDSKTPARYLKWAPNEPNTEVHYDCVFIGRDKEGGWAKGGCPERRRYICQRKSMRERRSDLKMELFDEPPRPLVSRTYSWAKTPRQQWKFLHVFGGGQLVIRCTAHTEDNSKLTAQLSRRNLTYDDDIVKKIYTEYYYRRDATYWCNRLTNHTVKILVGRHLEGKRVRCCQTVGGRSKCTDESRIIKVHHWPSAITVTSNSPKVKGQNVIYVGRPIHVNCSGFFGDKGDASVWIKGMVTQFILRFSLWPGGPGFTQVEYKAYNKPVKFSYKIKKEYVDPIYGPFHSILLEVHMKTFEQYERIAMATNNFFDMEFGCLPYRRDRGFWNVLQIKYVNVKVRGIPHPPPDLALLDMLPFYHDSPSLLYDGCSFLIGCSGHVNPRGRLEWTFHVGGRNWTWVIEEVSGLKPPKSAPGFDVDISFRVSRHSMIGPHVTSLAQLNVTGKLEGAQVFCTVFGRAMPRWYDYSLSSRVVTVGVKVFPETPKLSVKQISSNSSSPTRNNLHGDMEANCSAYVGGSQGMLQWVLGHVNGSVSEWTVDVNGHLTGVLPGGMEITHEKGVSEKKGFLLSSILTVQVNEGLDRALLACYSSPVSRHTNGTLAYLKRGPYRRAVLLDLELSSDSNGDTTSYAERSNVEIPLETLASILGKHVNGLLGMLAGLGVFLWAMMRSYKSTDLEEKPSYGDAYKEEYTADTSMWNDTTGVTTDTSTDDTTL